MSHSPDEFASVSLLSGSMRTSVRDVNNSKGFAHKLETFLDDSSGVVFQDRYCTSRASFPPKVLSYSARKVLLEPGGAWRAFGSRARHATAVAGSGLGGRLLVFGSITFVFGLLSPVIQADAEEAVSSLNNLIAAGLFFLLGPFVGTVGHRWWSIRKDCVGGLWGVVDDLSTFAAGWFASKSLPDRTARALVLRLGLLSHALLFKQARGEDDDLDDVIQAGLLLPHEAAALAPLTSKAQVVWAWQLRLWTRLLSGDFGASPIPHATHVAPLVMERCVQGRAAIGTAMAFIDTQQPFPYVHLLSMITDVSLMVNSIYVGIHTGRELQDDKMRWSGSHLFNVGLLIAFAALRVASFALIYVGLLAIGAALDNPMGGDPADLPELAYQVYMKNECEAFSAGVDAIDTNDGWWEGLGQRQVESVPAPNSPQRFSRRHND